MFNSRHVLAALALVLVAGGANAAQTNAPRPLAPPPQARQDIRESRLEARLAFMKSELRITPAQMAAWDAFAEAMRAEARARIAARTNPPPAAEPARERPSVVDELAARSERLAAERDRVQRRLAALRPFYAALNDEQRRRADRLLDRDGDRDRWDRMRARFRPDFASDRRWRDRPFYR